MGSPGIWRPIKNGKLKKNASNSNSITKFNNNATNDDTS